MSTVGLGVSLELLTAKFEQGVNTANGHLNKLTKTADAANKVFGALLVAGGGATFVGLVKSSLDAANRLGDMSARLGVTVEGLSRLEYAAKLTGVSSNTLATGLQRMTRRVAEAAQGSGEAIGALNELGLSAEKLNKLRPEEQFEVFADALEAVPNQADKVRLGMKLLDSEGVALLQTMKGGSAAIRAMGEESDKTGNTISTKFANDVTAANAAMIKLGASTTGLTNQLVATMGPAISDIANWLSSNLPNAAARSQEAISLMAAGATKSLAYLVEFIRVPTFLLGKISSEAAAADAKLYAIQKNLDGATEVIFENMLKTKEETEKFSATVGQSSLKIEDFIGKTESATEKTKKATEATKARTAALKDFQSISDTFNSVRSSLLTEEQAETESYQKRLQQVQEFIDANTELRTLGLSVIEQEKQRHEEALTEIEKTEKKKREALAMQEFRSRIGVASGMFSNLSTLMNTESKKMFQIGKTAAIAGAIVNGLEAVVSSYAAGSEIGGPVLGAAFAATAAAATGAQIQNIKSQQFGGGGTVTAGTSGGAGPGVYQPSQPIIPNGPQSQGGGVNIVFQGDVNGLDEETLAETLANYIEKTDFIFMSATSRNGQLLRGV